MAVTAGCCGPAGGGEPFTCDQLAGCSIGDVGDVDTSTTPPEPGQHLEWDGEHWVPVPPGDTTVVGGETDTTVTHVDGTGDEDDPYIVTTDVKIAGGDNALSIEPDGLFAPRHYFDALRLEFTSVAGFVDLDEIVPVGGGRIELGEITGQFANPSPTLPMRAVLEVSVNHGQIGLREPNTTVQYWSRVEVSGSVVTALESHQRVLDRREGEQELDYMGSTKQYPITIPPGGIVNLRLVGQMQLSTYSGRADMNELNHIATIWGGTFQ